MEPKINTEAIEAKVSPVPPGELPGSEVGVWDPPFERWMRMADELLGSGWVALPKAPPGDSKARKH